MDADRDFEARFRLVRAELEKANHCGNKHSRQNDKQKPPTPSGRRQGIIVSNCRSLHVWKATRRRVLAIQRSATTYPKRQVKPGSVAYDYARRFVWPASIEEY
jgi:hypothetical protein